MTNTQMLLIAGVPSVAIVLALSILVIYSRIIMARFNRRFDLIEQRMDRMTARLEKVESVFSK